MEMATQAGAAPTRTRPAVLLRSRQDLEAYVADRRWLGRHGEIVLRFAALAGAERHAVQARLNFWRRVCGCLPGGLTVFAAMVWWGIALAQSEIRTAGMLAATAAYVVALGIAVKFAAIALARIALVLEIARLRWRLQASDDLRGE